MKLQELFEENDDRTFPTPLKVRDETVRRAFALADDVENAIEVWYRKKFQPKATYVEALLKGRQIWGKKQDVPLADVVGTESHLVKDHLEKLQREEKVKTSSDIPLLYKVGKLYIVADGNHRVAKAKIAGDDTIKCLVLDLSNLRKAPQLKV